MKISKTLILLISFQLVIRVPLVNSQTFQWAQRGGLWEYDYGYGISTDNLGNVFVAGKFELNAVFGNDTLPNQGNHDIFVAEYSSSGQLKWLHTGGGPSGDYAHALACDVKINQVFVSGEVQNLLNGPAARVGTTTIVFPGTPSVTLNAIGENDACVMSYNMDGSLLWARNAGGYYDDKAQAVCYDDSGNVYMAGYFNDTAYFSSNTTFNNNTLFGNNTTTITGSNTGLNDMFVAKYDKNGNFLWVRQAGGPGRDEAKGLGCDGAGNVYVCGLYSDGAVFGNLPPFPNTGHYNTFLAKYSPDGNLQWVRSSLQGPDDNVAWALTLDKNGLIYVGGEFNASVYFGNNELITNGMADVFVACYDESGNVLWATSAGGKEIDRARGIGTDGTNIYITGQFGDSSATSAFGHFNLRSADSSDIFVAELDNAGNFIYAKSVGGPPDSLELLGYESGNAISADAAGNAYATGSTLQGGIFGNTHLEQYSRTDFFITKVSPLTTGVNVMSDDGTGGVRIYPNPANGSFTMDLNNLKNQKVEISLFNSLGQQVGMEERFSPGLIGLNLSCANGIYFVVVKTEDQAMYREKIIIQNQ